MRIGISCLWALIRNASGNNSVSKRLLHGPKGGAYDDFGRAAGSCIPFWQASERRDFGRMRGREERRRGGWVFSVTAMACALPLALAACGNNGPPDFALSLASGQTATATITQGGTTPIQFEVAAVSGSTGSITLVLSGLPTGVGVAPGSATVGIGSPQTFQLNAAANAQVTSAPVTLTATGVSGNPLSSSSITHTQTLTLSVAAPATP